MDNDQPEVDHAEAVNFEKEYDQEVSFFLGSSTKPLSLLQETTDADRPASTRSTSGDDGANNTEKRSLKRQTQVEDQLGLQCRDDLMVCVTVTAASDPNIAEHSREQAVRKSPDTIISSFEQTERQFREEFLSPDILERAEKLGSESPITPEVRRGETAFKLPPPSPGRGPASPTVGLGNLDNLVRMMEVLSVLKDENKTLKKKCAYLEDTRALLQVQNDMLLTKETNGTRYQQKMRVMDYLNKSGSSRIQRGPSEKKVSHRSRRRSRPQRGTSESSDTGETTTNADQSPQPQKLGLHHRSQSVGSIEMVDLDLSTMTVQEQYRSKSAEKSRKHQFSRAAKTSKKFQAKWERVKKVFAGKPEQATGREGSAISAEQLVKVNSRLKRKNKPPNLPHVQSETSFSAGEMDHLKPGDPRLGFSHSTAHLGEPPSPSSVQSEPPQSMGAFNMDDPTLGDLEPTPSASPACSPRGRSPSVSSASSEEGAEVKAAFENQSKSISVSRHTCSSPYLTVQALLPRRKSSPTLSTREQADLIKRLDNRGRGGDVIGKEDSHLRRSSSYKDRTARKTPSDVTISPSPIKAAGKDTARKARAAWGKVKDIIHTRKDSLKRRNQRTMSAGDGLLEGFERELSPGSPPRGSPSDSEIAYNRRTSPLGIRGASPPDTETPRMSRVKTKAKSAPRRARKSLQKAKSTSPSDTPPLHRKRQSLANVAMSGASPDEIAAILGVSDDFTKKMAEWEAKKKGHLVKANSFSCEEFSKQSAEGKETTKFTEDFIKKMEEWEQMKACASPRQRTSVCVRDGTQSPAATDQKIADPGISPPPQLESSISYEEILSESFTKTVQEWERVKEKRAKSTGSPTPQEGRRLTHRASRKDERSKSRERDRSRHKYEKDIQKIEKKEMFIERERQKLEKMKMKLDMSMESSSSSQESQGLSQGFMKKLHEWEVMKGFKAETEYSVSTKTFRDRVFSEGSILGLTGSASPPSPSSPASTAPFPTRSISNIEPPVLSPSRVEVLRQDSFQPARVLVDDSTSVDFNLIRGSTTSLEEKNVNLLQDLQRKEEDIATLQAEIQQLMDSVHSVRDQHNHDIENYRRELWATSKLGKYTIESDLMAACLHDLGTQIRQLEEYGERVAHEKHSLEVRQLEEAHIRSQVESRLLEEIEKLQIALDKKSHMGNIGLEVFNRLYEYVRRVQAQVNQLKISVHERNRLIAELERHLLVQEVTNKLLAANMERRKVELSYFKESRRRGTIKRWRTFNGADIRIRNDGFIELTPLDPDSCIDVQPSYKDLQRNILKLTHEDVDSLTLHFDWLEGLKSEVEKEALPTLEKEEGSKSEVANNTAQTVMTLCNCDYVPVNGSSTPKPHDSVAIQTSIEDVASEPAKPSSISKELFPASRFEPFSRGVSSDVQRTSSFKERKRKSNEQLIESNVRVRDSNSDPTKEEKKVRRISYSEWLEREPKPLQVDLDIPLTKTSVDPQPATTESAVDKKESLFAMSKRQKSCDEDDAEGAAASPGMLEVDCKPPQLPHSPIIRSKNPRKIKAAVQHIYADSRTWKATPPRRMIRHRRAERPDSELLSRTAPASPDLGADVGSLLVRGRTCSDGASRAPLGRGSAPSERQFLTVEGSERKKAAGATSDAVSKLEHGSPTPQEGGQLFTKSSSPITVSPVRGLKSAAVLMRESGERRRRSVTSQDQGSGSRNSLHVRPVSGGSSDKENDKADGAGDQRKPGGGCGGGGGGKGSVSSDSPRQESGSGSSKGKSLLKDRTNSKQKQTLVEESRTSSTATRLSVKDQAQPGEAAEIWQKSQSSPKASAKKKSDSKSADKNEKGSARSSPRAPDKSKQRKSASEEAGGGSSWFSRPKSPGMFKKSTGANSPRSSQRSGAISSLCMQAMSVSVDEPEGPPQTPTSSRHSRGSIATTASEGSGSTPGTPSSSGTPERRKGKGKFLDGAWLQKPKRFFKVSKSSLLGMRSGAKRRTKSSEDVSREGFLDPTPPTTPTPGLDKSNRKSTGDEFSYYEVIGTPKQRHDFKPAQVATETSPPPPAETEPSTATQRHSGIYETVADIKQEIMELKQKTRSGRETVIEGPVNMDGVYENIVVEESGYDNTAAKIQENSGAAHDNDDDVPVYQTIEHTTLIELKETRIGGDEMIGP